MFEFEHDKTNKTPRKRDRHGFRSVPPLPAFSLAVLPDDTLVSDLEVAGYLRVARSTVAGWRNNPAHPLEWVTLPGGFRRTTAASLRAFMARGVRRRRIGLMAADNELAQ